MLITLEEARAQLNLGEDETDDDALITGYIAGAAKHLESRYGIVVDRSERTFVFDRFSAVMILKTTSIDADSVEVAYLDSDGASQQLADARVVPAGEHFRIVPAVGADWPMAASGAGVISVTAQVGYEQEADSSDAVPADIKAVGKLLVAHWYLNREAAAREMGELPLGVTALLNPYDPPRV